VPSEVVTILVSIEGVTPLITHPFSAEARKRMQECVLPTGARPVNIHKNKGVGVMPPAKKEKETEVISLAPIKRQTILVPIEGITPLMTHRFSEKAKKQMLEDQVKTRTKAKRPPQDPEAEYHAARYIMEDGKRDGFPAVGFKAAIVGAARLFDGISMTALKQAIYVQGEGSEQLIHIQAEPRMREDVTRVGMGTANLRYRPEYWPWKALLPVTYVPSMIDESSVLALVDAAGMGGVGEWRPSAPKSATGSYGQFHAVDAMTVAV
jgi:hypothetical protein